MKQTQKKQSSADTKSTPGSQPFSTSLESSTGLLELFTDGIKEMYWSENHLVKAIPKMISAAGATELKKAFSEHWEVTKNHAARLESIFESMGMKIQAAKCDACEGLVMSGEHVIENTEPGTEARDTGLIMAALKVENFEITSYTGLIQLSATLGHTEVAEVLKQNLAEEMEADQVLTSISQKNNSAPSKAAPKSSAKKAS